MTMHLVRGMTSLNTRKNKKRKLTLGKIAKFQEQMLAHNKDLRRKGLHNLQMDLQEFIDYCHGEYKPKPRTNSTSTLKPVDTYRRPTQDIPSGNESFAPCVKKEGQQYTGERKLVGIAMMHKSNLVPVFADDDDKTGSKQATEIAQMRRN